MLHSLCLLLSSLALASPAGVSLFPAKNGLSIPSFPAFVSISSPLPSLLRPVLLLHTIFRSLLGSESLEEESDCPCTFGQGKAQVAITELYASGRRARGGRGDSASRSFRDRRSSFGRDEEDRFPMFRRENPV